MWLHKTLIGFTKNICYDGLSSLSDGCLCILLGEFLLTKKHDYSVDLRHSINCEKPAPMLYKNKKTVIYFKDKITTHVM